MGFAPLGLTLNTDGFESCSLVGFTLPRLALRLEPRWVWPRLLSLCPDGLYHPNLLVPRVPMACTVPRWCIECPWPSLQSAPAERTEQRTGLQCEIAALRDPQQHVRGSCAEAETSLADIEREHLVPELSI